MVKEARDIVGTSRTYSNRRGRKNKCSSNWKPLARTRRKKRNEKGFFCNGCG